MLRVLYEDNHLLALDKPAGLPMVGALPDVPTLVDAAKEHLRQKYEKPGNVFLGVTSRLDAAVSGVVLLARTSKAASRLMAQFRDRDVQKEYWAIVAGSPPQHGEYVDFLLKDDAAQRMRVVGQGTPAAKEARLAFRCLATFQGGALLEVCPTTGRKHQIRVQLAARGFPIWGDEKYGSQRPFARGIALHARRLVVEHPVRHTPLELVAPLPKYWPAICRQIEAGLSDNSP
ncbi:MAG: RluA family pseudouridine synthase [Planctomycetia bacterium]|nr:RluA family pseudouridine synthase [Planctomycetia bacterium]